MRSVLLYERLHIEVNKVMRPKFSVYSSTCAPLRRGAAATLLTAYLQFCSLLLPLAHVFTVSLYFLLCVPHCFTKSRWQTVLYVEAPIQAQQKDTKRKAHKLRYTRFSIKLIGEVCSSLCHRPTVFTILSIESLFATAPYPFPFVVNHFRCRMIRSLPTSPRAIVRGMNSRIR